MASFKSAPRLTATTTLTPTGAGVAPGSFIINNFTVLYSDTATGNTIAVQTLLSDGITWITIQTITTGSSGVASFSGKFFDVRAVVTAHPTTSTIVVDVLAGD